MNKIWVFYCHFGAASCTTVDLARFQVKSDVTIADTEWHHVAAVIDTTTTVPEENIRIFIDGVESSHTTTDGFPGTGINVPTSTALGIGASNVGTGPFAGRLDEVECLACGTRWDRQQFQAVLERRNPRFAALASTVAPDGDADLGEVDLDGFDVSTTHTVIVDMDATGSGEAEIVPRESGMPVLEVWKSRHVFVCKRGQGTGYSGIENPLFFKDNTRMYYGDARASIDGLLHAITG